MTNNYNRTAYKNNTAAYRYMNQPERASYTNPVCESCGKGDLYSVFPDDYSYAMAYIPFQKYNDVYPADKALKIGTLFPCLDKPWMVSTRGCVR